MRIEFNKIVKKTTSKTKVGDEERGEEVYIEIILKDRKNNVVLCKKIQFDVFYKCFNKKSINTIPEQKHIEDNYYEDINIENENILEERDSNINQLNSLLYFLETKENLNLEEAICKEEKNGDCEITIK